MARTVSSAHSLSWTPSSSHTSNIPAVGVERRIVGERAELRQFPGHRLERGFLRVRAALRLAQDHDLSAVLVVGVFFQPGTQAVGEVHNGGLLFQHDRRVVVDLHGKPTQQHRTERRAERHSQENARSVSAGAASITAMANGTTMASEPSHPQRHSGPGVDNVGHIGCGGQQGHQVPPPQRRPCGHAARRATAARPVPPAQTAAGSLRSAHSGFGQCRG